MGNIEMPPLASFGQMGGGPLKGIMSDPAVIGEIGGGPCKGVMDIP